MGTPHYNERLRRQILKNRGLQRVGHGRLEPKAIRPKDPRLTLAMRLIEARFHQPIDDLIWDGTLEQVGNMLDMAPSTISKWRKRMGLR